MSRYSSRFSGYSSYSSQVSWFEINNFLFGEKMSNSKEKAIELLKQWKGDSYLFGLDILSQFESVARKYKGKALVFSSIKPYMKDFNDRVLAILAKAGVEVTGGGIVSEAKPNSPREDVYRLESYILHYKPDFLVVVGGGSSIDSVKAANVLAALGGAVTPEIDH